jgi:hypothetical protein
MKHRSLIFTVIISLILSSCDSGYTDPFDLPEELIFSGEIISCSDFGVSQLLEAGNSNVALNISGTYRNSRETLNLTTDFKSFSLPNDSLHCNILVWNAPVNSYLCNDVPDLTINRVHEWTAISGELKIKLSDLEVTEFETYYRITIQLDNVVFEKDTEQRVVKSLLIEDAGVGWFPG